MKNEIVIGIDEAGMGPVFGPLVVCGVALYKRDLKGVRALGVADSKRFGSGRSARRKRETVCSAVSGKIVKKMIIAVEPEMIESGNLYTLHVDSVKAILRELSWPSAESVIIDRVGGLKRESFLKMLGFWHSGFIYENKADEKFTAVSLASMFAKTMRDRAVEGLCREMGESYVSGYANAATENLLRRYFEKHGALPPGTRVSYSWKPINDMLSASGDTLF